jgi:hypothetical protein
MILRAIGAICVAIGMLAIIKGYDIIGTAAIAVGVFWASSQS